MACTPLWAVKTEKMLAGQMKAVERTASYVVTKLVPEEIRREVGRRDPQALLLVVGWFIPVYILSALCLVIG